MQCFCVRRSGTIGVVGAAATRITSVTARFMDHLANSRGLADDRAVRRCCRSIRWIEEPDGGASKHRDHDRSHICNLFVLLLKLNWNALPGLDRLAAASDAKGNSP